MTPSPPGIRKVGELCASGWVGRSVREGLRGNPLAGRRRRRAG